MAEPVGAGLAEQAVNGWLAISPLPLDAGLGNQIETVRTFSNAQGTAVYYVVELEPSGFVVVSADDTIEPIICFSASGKYSVDDNSPLWEIVGADVPARVQQAASVQDVSGAIQPSSASAEQQALFEAREKWDMLTSYSGASTMLMSVSDVSNLWIEPLVQSTWGQFTVGDYSDGVSCYNYYTPPYEAGDANNYPCGCVATAMAQLIRYHEHSAVFYDWANMPLAPDFGINLLERQAIGQFCFYVAEAIDTIYSQGSSGGSQASLAAASGRLRDRFGYSNSIYSSTPVPGAVFNNMINTNLDAGCPVLLGLNGPSGGHSVVCDGYGYDSATLYHHLNMGWSGRYDLWYALPTIESLYSFNVVHSCVYNIFESGSGEIVSGRITDIAGNPISGVQIEAAVSGASTRYSESNSDGIYALANLPSNRSIVLTASKSPHAFVAKSVTTGNSVNYGGTSGNLWGVNFVSNSLAPPDAQNQSVLAVSGEAVSVTLGAGDEGLPNPPGMLSYMVTSLPEHGRLTDPSVGRITSVPYTLVNYGNVVEYLACSYFSGPDSFEFVADDGGMAPQGGVSETGTIGIDVTDVTYRVYAPSGDTVASWPMTTRYHDSRTQVIYPAEEVGGSGKITGLELNLHTMPAQTLKNWTVRIKHTNLAAYENPALESSGWMTAYKADEAIDSVGWIRFDFQNAFGYNGVQNLLIDFSHNNDSASTDAMCRVSETGDMRVVMAFSDSADGDPLDWSGQTSPSIYVSDAVPNIKLVVETFAVPLAGDFDQDCDVDIYDFAAMASAWLSQSGDSNWDPVCDISGIGDGIVNELDFAVLAQHWLDEE